MQVRYPFAPDVLLATCLYCIGHDQYRLVICLTNVIGWKLNQLGLVSVSNQYVG